MTSTRRWTRSPMAKPCGRSSRSRLMNNHHRFRDFVARFSTLAKAAGSDESRMLDEGGRLLAELVSHDDWLPEEFARESAQSYRQYLLYCDPQERFSVVSFVWGPGQTTPVHDHTVWGMVGVMRGAEACEEFGLEPAAGRLRSRGTH